MGWIILIIFLIWFLGMFVISRFIIPNLGFHKSKLPDKISLDIIARIDELKRKSKNAAQFLELAYKFLGSRYHIERLNTIFKIHYNFLNINEVWKKKGYMPCTQSNYMMRVFLVKSGFFQEEDIRIKHTFAFFSIHQYLQVKVDRRWIDVDVGEQAAGMLIGKHYRFFGLI